MLSKAFRQNTKANHLLRLLLVFALAFAALHVALHDINMSGVGLDGNEHCQVCRLNHVPLASLPLPALLASLAHLAYVKPDVVPQYHPLNHLTALRARAPPLF